MNEKERLQKEKTQLLQELHTSMREENEAILEKNMERLAQLAERVSAVMAKIDATDARLRELMSPILEGQDSSVLLTEEQKYLLAEMKQLHKQMMGELIKQRTALVEQMKELREVDHMIGMYKKTRSMEGVFVDHKK